MVHLESSPLFGVFSCSEAMMKGETINNQDSSGDTCSVSDPTVASSTNCYSISSSPVTTADKDDGSAAKNDAVCYINVKEKDKSWLRLGIGPEDQSNTASYKLQRCCSSINASGREKSLELSLFSSSAGAVTSSLDQSLTQPPPPSYPHDQLLTMRGPSSVYNQQLIRPQTSLNRGYSFPSSKPWTHTVPFRPSSSSNRDVTNNSCVTRNCCPEEGGAGPSSEFRVLDPPKRPHSGLWFLLQASQFQEKGTVLASSKQKLLENQGWENHS